MAHTATSKSYHRHYHGGTQSQNFVNNSVNIVNHNVSYHKNFHQYENHHFYNQTLDMGWFTNEVRIEMGALILLLLCIVFTMTLVLRRLRGKTGVLLFFSVLFF